MKDPGARLGERSKVSVTRLGLGCASIGNLYKEIVRRRRPPPPSTPPGTPGIRYFDTAPHYGLGLSERRLGAALRDRPRGRVRAQHQGRPAAGARPGRRRPAATTRASTCPPRSAACGTSRRDGVRRSLEESLDRLGLDRVDIVLIHDPEESDHVDAGGRRGLPGARASCAPQGVVGAIGVGSKQLADAAPASCAETDIDVIMLAGRYTLLEQPALDELLPACVERGVSRAQRRRVQQRPARRRPPARRPARTTTPPPRPTWSAARQAIADVCARHGVSLPAAALAFARRPPGGGLGRHGRRDRRSTCGATSRCSRPTRRRRRCGPTSSPRGCCAPTRRVGAPA